VGDLNHKYFCWKHQEVSVE